jgi:hypothetical protein
MGGDHKVQEILLDRVLRKIFKTLGFLMIGRILYIARKNGWRPWIRGV